MLSPLIKKLLFVRQFEIDQGKISILGKRHIMLSDQALLELQEIDETKFYDLVKRATIKQLGDFVDHAKVYENLKGTLLTDVDNLSKKLGGREGIVKTLQNIFDLYGLGLIEIEKLNNDKKEAIIKVRDSTIAKAYKDKGRQKSKKPVCVITAAVIASIFSFLFKKQVDAAEVRCLAQGSGFCEFVVK